jgi:hypothetical protein
MRTSKTREVANVSTCAALYAVAISVTASVPTPWGVGQFRPGVLIPAIYAFVGGPIEAGLGAAIGTFIGSFILQATGTGLGPLGSLISGSPANFIGFYLLGWFISKYRSWNGFILGTFASLVLGNLIAAGGVVVYLTYVVPRWLTMALDVKLMTIVGLTLFWTTTMLPFVLIPVPILISGLTRSGLSIMNNGEFTYLRYRSSKGLIYPSLCVAGILTVIYGIIMLTSIGNLLFASVVKPQTVFWVKSLFVLTSGILVAFSIIGMLLASKTSTTHARQLATDRDHSTKDRSQIPKLNLAQLAIAMD